MVDLKILLHIVAGASLFWSGHHDQPGPGQRISFFRLILNHVLALAFLFASWYFWDHPFVPYITGFAAIFSCLLPVSVDEKSSTSDALTSPRDVPKPKPKTATSPETSPHTPAENGSSLRQQAEEVRTSAETSRPPIETLAIWVTLISGAITIGYLVCDVLALTAGQ